MYELQDKVIIENKEYKISQKGDYRMVLNCFEVMEDTTLTTKEKCLSSLFIFYEDFKTPIDLMIDTNLEKLYTEMCMFFNCGKIDTQGGVVRKKLIDWKQDEVLIISAINNVAHKEVRAEEYIHWWTFMGYYFSIGESVLSTVVGIRDKMTKGKKLEKYEKEFRRNNPSYFIWKQDIITNAEDEALMDSLVEIG